MRLRTCESAECRKEFDPISPRQTFCSDRCGTRERQRRYRAKHRKNGGGGGGNGGGGGGEPTLFDSITPQDSRAIYVPDTNYRTPDQESNRKPSTGVEPLKSSKAAA
jgi:hypothetical protein